MKPPVVSVIMPTYNHADYVEQAIASVLAQEGVEFEFIIADDGSSDATRDRIATVKDKRIRFIPNTVNRGACIVNNELIEQANGEFIALINSDDYWIGTDKLASQLEIMQNNSELAACFGKANFVDKFGEPIEKSTLPFGSVFEQENRSSALWLRYFFDHGNCLCHPTILIRKKCYEHLGYYNNRLRQLPDFDMWTRIVKKYPIYIQDRELINFRILPGENASSPTTTNSIRTLNEHLLIAQNLFDELTKEQLIEGFSDYLIYKDIPTAEHLDIEKALFYFQKNQWLDRPYQMIGLQKMYQLLNSNTHQQCLTKEYEIDDRWFQQKMGEIDILVKSPEEKLHTQNEVHAQEQIQTKKKQFHIFSGLRQFLNKNHLKQTKSTE